MERGLRIPRVKSVVLLAQVLGISPAMLAFGDRRALTGELNVEGLAERARSTRELRGLTLHALGLLAGSSYGQAQAIEAGAEPTIEILCRFSKALGVAESWLAFGLGNRDLPRRGSKRAEPAIPAAGSFEPSVRADAGD